MLAAGVPVFSGTVKKCESEYTGRVKNIVAESPISLLRDADMQEEGSRNLSAVDVLLRDIVPSGITIDYRAARRPLIQYAFRSGSIITHLNTICSMVSLNWRQQTVSATEAVIVISEAGETTPDPIILKENTDIFRLKVDKSLFKKYTHVTAIGVEQEVSGYTCTASLPATEYFYLDCDDAELGDDEIIPKEDAHAYLTPLYRFDKISLRYGAQLKGWDAGSTVFRVNEECFNYSSKMGADLFGITRGYWESISSEIHSPGDPCILAKSLPIITPDGSPATLQTATTLFKIGTEIVQGTLDSGAILLATYDPNTMLYVGRGLEYATGSNLSTPAGWISHPYNSYAHKQGAVVTPYYPDLDPATSDSTLAITIHGKGIVTKDGIDKLAWGALLNVQNGIISGSGTYKCADFFDKNIAVGQKLDIVTASSYNGTMLLEPSTTYHVIIYSITTKQNSLAEIEFGNVIPEVLHMLKSGEYALQAAVRKTAPFTAGGVDQLSISGKTGMWKQNTRVRLSW